MKLCYLSILLFVLTIVGCNNNKEKKYKQFPISTATIIIGNTFENKEVTIQYLHKDGQYYKTNLLLPNNIHCSDSKILIRYNPTNPYEIYEEK